MRCRSDVFGELELLAKQGQHLQGVAAVNVAAVELLELSPYHLHQLLVRGMGQVLLIEPMGFVDVKLGAAFGNLFQGEGLDQFGHAEQLSVVRRMPAQQGQHVGDGFGEVTRLSVSAGGFTRLGIGPLKGEHREAQAISVAFGQFAVSFGLQQEGQVSKLGHHIFPAQVAVQHHVQRGRWQPLFSANDMADAHQIIVNDVRQMVGRHAIALEQNFVIHGGGIHDHPSANFIVKANLFLSGQFDANHVGISAFQTSFHLVLT